MNRLDLIDAIRVSDRSEERVLDFHSARYAGLSRVEFRFTIYIVNESERNRPDLVARNVYKDSRMWFYLYQFNGIIDPVTETLPGLQLRVPDLAQLKSYLSARDVTDAKSKNSSDLVEL